jgi:hypothetical protein
LAGAVSGRLENDLKLFNQEHMIESETKNIIAQGAEETKEYASIDEKELEKFVAPAYPEAFASGCIINGFTP